MTMPALRDLNRRVRTQGRIRMGKKKKSSSGKEIAGKLDTFRFTAPDRTVIEQVAEMYGGKVAPWHDDRAAPKDQFEVITEARAVDVWLPPGAITVGYEKWGGKGCERRCDGVDLELEVEKGKGVWETQFLECICNAKGVRECDPKTRLSVILPGVNFGGIWRLESKGWNAAEELPAIAEQIEQLQTGGILAARLTFDHRASRGGTQQYVVPGLELTATPQALMSGGAAVGALGAGSVAALDAGPSAPWDPDDEVVEAEIVEDDDALAALVALAEQALAVDDEAPMVTALELVQGLCESNTIAEVSRKLAGVADRKAVVVRERDGWKVIKR